MKKISRTIINFWLDALLLALFVSLLWCSVVLQFVFPPGELSTDWRLWGLGYQNWRDIQFGALCIFALAILVHVMLHWNWVCGVVATQLVAHDAKGRVARRDDGSRTLWGVGLLIGLVNLVGLAVAAAALSIQSPSPGL